MEREKRDSLDGTTFYLTGFGQYSFRRFEDESVYGNHAERYNESASYSGGTNLGVIMPMSKNIALDIGISYFGHSEEYLFEDAVTDSTFHYKRTYMQIGLPVKLRYTLGEDFQFFAFLGIMPLNILNIRYKEDYTRNDGIIVEKEVDLIKDNFTQFNLMASGGFGINYNMDYIGFTLYPEYRHYLLNTYADVSVPLKHKMYSFALHLGVLLRF